MPRSPCQHSAALSSQKTAVALTTVTTECLNNGTTHPQELTSGHTLLWDMSSLWLSSFILLAATLGDWSSSALLGRLYSIGEGVSTDYAGEGKSKEWYDAVETQTRLLSCTPQVTCRNQGSLLLGGWGQCISRQILCQLLPAGRETVIVQQQ